MKRILILVAIIISLFLAIFLFTRPYIFEGFNLSQTGSIGDTIGGITSPIINLLAAFLVYYSFQEQVKANTILTNEISEQKLDKNFQITLKLFDDLKESYRKLKHDNKEDQSALNTYSNQFILVKNIEEYKNHIAKPIFFDFEFLICEYDLLMNHLDNSKMNFSEKERLSIIVHNFFHTKLEYSVDIFIEMIFKYDKKNGILRNLNYYKKRAVEFK